MKRSPMRRSQKPMTRKPMKQSTKGLAPRSKKMEQFYRTERVPFVASVLTRNSGTCQVCNERRSVQVHEILTRGRGGGIMAPGVNEEDNVLAVCAQCHQWITEHPAEAKVAGLVRSATHGTHNDNAGEA